MTDEEIVEVVNYCQSQNACSPECPFWERANFGSKGGDCDKRLGKVAFEFIHRLLAENGSLRNEIESIKARNVVLCDEADTSAAKAIEAKIRADKLEATLFAVVHDSMVFPVGLRLGKSQKEITDMTFATIDDLQKRIDYEKIKKIMEELEK